ncbi:MAG: ferredoxin, partial [Prochlorothrix sp.]
MKSSNWSEIVENLGIPHIRYHLFICADATKPKCCDPQVGLATWDYLKTRLRELKLDQVQVDPTTQEPGCVYRTKANCLRICQQG